MAAWHLVEGIGWDAGIAEEWSMTEWNGLMKKTEYDKMVTKEDGEWERETERGSGLLLNLQMRVRA